MLRVTLGALLTFPALIAADTAWSQASVGFAEVDRATDSDNQDRHLTTALIGAEYRAWRQITDPAWIGFGAGATSLRYANEDGDAMNPTVAWIRGGGSYFFREWLACTSQVAIGWSGESGADAGEALQVFATLGPEVYTAADRSIFLGVMLRTRAEQSPRIIPLVTVDWAFTPQWRLQIFDQIDQLSRLRYRWHPQWETNLRLDLALHSFALDNDGQATALADEHSTLGIEFGWLPMEDRKSVLRAYIGSTLQRHLSYRNDAGNLLSEQDFSPSLCFGLNVRLYF